MCDMKGLSMMGREREISGKVGTEQWGIHVGMGKTTRAGGQTFGSLGDKSELCWLLVELGGGVGGVTWVRRLWSKCLHAFALWG